MYLVSCGAQPLAPDARLIVGLSAETTCFVASDYFRSTGRFDDFIVHEAAHIFHNCKRRTIGLASTRHREWLLDIDYRKRETFAYACETYSRVLTLGKSSSARLALLSEIESGPLPPDDRVDPAEYIDVLRDAIASRNGWKRIHGRCASAKSMGVRGSAQN